MGIKSINKTLKEHSSGAYGTIPITYFSGYRIGIDGNGWVYSRVAIICKSMIMSMVDPFEELDRGEMINRLINSLIVFTCKLMKDNVSLIWCWDGSSPEEKSHIRAARTKAKTRVITKIEEAKQALLDSHILLRTPEKITKYKQLRSQNTSVTPKEMRLIAEVIKGVGLSSVNAISEGEKLAASLAREGIVKAVWSTDTDNHALGTQLMLTGFSGKNEQGVPLVEFVSTVTILHCLTIAMGWDELGMKFGLANFLDLAILHGTDFNPNIKGIGPKRAWNLIKKYGCIEYIEEYEKQLDVTVLNYKKTRELFSYEPSGYRNESSAVNVNKSLNFSDLAVQYGFQDLIFHINTSMTFVTCTPKLAEVDSYDGVINPRDFPTPQPSPAPAEVLPIIVPETKPKELVVSKLEPFK
jgi:flap endonuclease-1